MLNGPNSLTLFRIFASFVYLYYGWREEWGIALPIFCIAALTDMVDGALARLLGQRTRLGAFLDPMADKILMFFGFVSLTKSGFLPVLLTALVIARDLLIIIGLVILKSRKVRILYRPTYLSKMTTFFQIATLGLALLTAWGYSYPGLPVLVVVTGIFTAATGIQYFRIGWRLFKDAATETHPE